MDDAPQRKLLVVKELPSVRQDIWHAEGNCASCGQFYYMTKPTSALKVALKGEPENGAKLHGGCSRCNGHITLAFRRIVVSDLIARCRWCEGEVFHEVETGDAIFSLGEDGLMRRHLCGTRNTKA